MAAQCRAAEEDTLIRINYPSLRQTVNASDMRSGGKTGGAGPLTSPEGRNRAGKLAMRGVRIASRDK